MPPVDTAGAFDNRGWNTTITIAGGAKATISGAQRVSGRIDLRYEPDGLVKIAAQPADYIYPADVRLNDARDRLYMKADGLAGGLWRETWLYEYDLRSRKQLRKNRVDPAVLPPECEPKK